MKKLFFLLTVFTVFLSLVFYSCTASTTLTSWTNDSIPPQKFKKVFVMVLIKDLEYRISLEKKLAEEIKKSGIDAEPSLDKISPAYRYSRDELDTLFAKSDFDAVLTVKYEGAIEEKTKKDGMKLYKYYRKFSRPIRRKGYIESHKLIILESVLFSVETESDLWVATTKTLDSSGPKDFIESVSVEIIKDLKKNNLLK